ncbi:MAG: hypothetical protein EOM10_14780, partial [Opitutae bacterium]|nr:hypothetical protein [Opitutae bacterium]
MPAVLLATLVLAGCANTTAPGSTESPEAVANSEALVCDEALTAEQQTAWDGALALDAAALGDEARAAALEALTAIGRLPADDPATVWDECADARELVAPKGISALERLRKDVTTVLESWWAWMALAVVLVIAAAARGVQTPLWRRKGWYPRVRLSNLVVDGAAAPEKVGDQVAGRVRARLAMADKANPLPSLRLADPADATLGALPLDPIPEQASWLVKLGGWMSGLNTLTPHLLLSEPDAKGRTVGCTVRIDDRRGHPVKRKSGGSGGDAAVSEELIVIPTAGVAAEASDYHELSEFVAIWLQLEVCLITGRGQECRERLGTDQWIEYR